ncbi:MAG: hypothetical protein ACQETR_02850 [Thermodesulfobacteriota bacterium]
MNLFEANRDGITAMLIFAVVPYFILITKIFIPTKISQNSLFVQDRVEHQIHRLFFATPLPMSLTIFNAMMSLSAMALSDEAKERL